MVKSSKIEKVFLYKTVAKINMTINQYRFINRKINIENNQFERLENIVFPDDFGQLRLFSVLCFAEE